MQIRHYQYPVKYNYSNTYLKFADPWIPAEPTGPESHNAALLVVVVTVASLAPAAAAAVAVHRGYDTQSTQPGSPLAVGLYKLGAAQDADCTTLHPGRLSGPSAAAARGRRMAASGPPVRSRSAEL